MRTKILTLIVVTSLLFISCGSSGWSCKKRYCDLQPSKTTVDQNESNQNESNCVVMEDFSETANEVVCR